MNNTYEQLLAGSKEILALEDEMAFSFVI